QLALAIARGLAQPTLFEQVLSMASIAEKLAGDPGTARRFLDDSAAVTTPLDDFPARISLLQARALNGFFQGDIETVKAVAAEGVRLGREVGDLYSLEMMLLNAGGTALMTGDLEQAKSFYTEALRIARRIDDRVAAYALLDGLGLGEPSRNGSSGREGAGTLLGKREVEVARLVAEGLSNKRIGARLFISERTVDSHVRSILNKLGFNSRAQIAGWMAVSRGDGRGEKI